MDKGTRVWCLNNCLSIYLSFACIITVCLSICRLHACVFRCMYSYTNAPIHVCRTYRYACLCIRTSQVCLYVYTCWIAYVYIHSNYTSTARREVAYPLYPYTYIYASHEYTQYSTFFGWSFEYISQFQYIKRCRRERQPLALINSIKLRLCTAAAVTFYTSSFL